MAHTARLKDSITEAYIAAAASLTYEAPPLLDAPQAPDTGGPTPENLEEQPRYNDAPGERDNYFGGMGQPSQPPRPLRSNWREMPYPIQRAPDPAWYRGGAPDRAWNAYLAARRRARARALRPPRLCPEDGVLLIGRQRMCPSCSARLRQARHRAGVTL